MDQKFKKRGQALINYKIIDFSIKIPQNHLKHERQILVPLQFLLTKYHNGKIFFLSDSEIKSLHILNWNEWIKKKFNEEYDYIDLLAKCQLIFFEGKKLLLGMNHNRAEYFQRVGFLIMNYFKRMLRFASAQSENEKHKIWSSLSIVIQDFLLSCDQ